MNNTGILYAYGRKTSGAADVSDSINHIREDGTKTTVARELNILGPKIDIADLGVREMNLKTQLIQSEMLDVQYYTTVHYKTLKAGDTVVTYEDQHINENSCFEWFADKDHSTLIPSNWSVSGHKLTINYASQSVDVTVGVKVSKGVLEDA